MQTGLGSHAAPTVLTARCESLPQRIDYGLVATLGPAAALTGVALVAGCRLLPLHTAGKLYDTGLLVGVQ